MENDQTTSPTPEKPVDRPATPNLLPFTEAIAAVAIGKTIGKQDWDAEPGYWARLIDGRVKIHKPDDKIYDWILSEGDLHGEDYYIINE